MRRTLTAVVAATALIGFSLPALACGGMKTASSVGVEIASSEKPTKPVQQTIKPTEQSR